MKQHTHDRHPSERCGPAAFDANANAKALGPSVRWGDANFRTPSKDLHA
jgi:hypothetical protein